MKRLILVLCLLVLLIPLKVKGIYATSAIVMDTDSRRILYSQNIHEIRSVASISKIMTALLAVESGKMENEVTIGEEILGSYGSGVYIKEGEKLKLSDLVYGLMLRSGNDAALAIAHYVGGDVNNFIVMMNAKAKEIGMKETTFNNPHGLDNPKGNYSSAYDMALLTSYAMQNSLYCQIVGTKHYTLKTNLNYYDWNNKNKLLNLYKYTTGGKTGFTEVAKRTLVTTASKDNLNLVTVTLNDGNDFNDHIDLFEQSFSNYVSYYILKKGIINVIGEDYYQNDHLYLEQDFRYPLLESEKNSIILKFELNKKSNYQSDDKIGIVKVFIGDKEINRQDVFIKLEKELTLWVKIKLWFKNLW